MLEVYRASPGFDTDIRNIFPSIINTNLCSQFRSLSFDPPFFFFVLSHPVSIPFFFDPTATDLAGRSAIVVLMYFE